MSYNSVKQSPKNRHCYGVSKTRSISDVIRTLRTSFLDTDYRAAVRELTEREECLRREKEEIVVGLREKSDILEAELRGLKIEKLLWDEEKRRLSRDIELNDGKLSDLAGELALARQKEKNAIKRCDLLLDDLRKLGSEEGKFMLDLSDVVDRLKRELREKEEEVNELVRKKDAQLNDLLEELEEVRRKFSCLEEEKLKSNALLDKLKREKDEGIKELLKRNEVEQRHVETQVKARLEELEDLQKTNASLEEQKAESDVRIEELWRSNEEKDKKLTKEIECLEREKRDIVKEKDEQIKELKKEKEGLSVEKRDLAAKLGLVEERVLKLEADVITCLCLDLGRDKRFESSLVGKILSGIIKALDSEEVGLTCNAGVINDENPHEADSAFVSHVNEPKCSLKSGKQSLDGVKRALDFEAEFSRDGATSNKRSTFADPIIIDSDDDSENLLHVNVVRNKRQCSGSLSEQHNHDGSSHDSLILVRQTKKLKHVPCKQVKQEPSLAALSTSRSDHLFNNYQRQTLPTLKKCEENQEPSLADDSRYSNGTPKADNLRSPQVEQLMTTLRQRKRDKKLECATDIICAVDEDDDFCAKAVCALYRLQKSLTSGMNGSILLGNKAFEKCDIERVAALAEFLIDEDPSGKMKKSVSALQEHDLRDCRKLAMKYSRQLIDIYKKRVDPLFSPMSTDLQYK